MEGFTSTNGVTAVDVGAKTSQNGVSPVPVENPPVVASLPDLRQLKFKLLNCIAALDRGALAQNDDKEVVAGLVRALESAAPLPELSSKNILSPLDGKWELLYSSVEVFRSSPFFYAFQQGLVQDRDLAREIFNFTNSIPGARKGRASQTLSLQTGKLISEVELSVFPGLSGTVVTTSSVSLDGNKLAVTVEDTRVSNSNLLPFLLDNVAVPVKDVFEQLRGQGATQVAYEVVYLDQDLRIVRALPDNDLFIYHRLF